MKLEILCSSLLLLISIPSHCQGSNILVLPVDGSHWINMDVILQALHSRGHDITVLRSSKSWYIKENSTYYKTITAQVEKALDETFITKLISDLIHFDRGALPWQSFFHVTVGTFDKFIEAHVAVAELISVVLDDQEMVQVMRDSNFDVLLTDPCWGGGPVLAKYFNLPVVYDVRWLIIGESHLFLAPSPVSYIPMTGSGLTDKMTFLQRVQNMFIYIVTNVQQRLLIHKVYQKLCDKHLGPGHDYYQLMMSADIWLMRADFVFEYPRPTMPNAVYMGGFQCKPARPLPQHLEEFVQSSGEHGVILMSLGTFVKELPEDVTEEIAASFAKLPQKVIWRFSGKKPATLGNNTMTVEWMPQNDLLGHPKVKLFVAHGGTNGVQEAIYHGVPVVGLPLFFDQYDNLLRLADRGGAKILSIRTVDKDDNFVNAVEEVLTDPSYRSNMQRLSRLHRDQPMKPLDTAVFWIEFVIRHKGAAHLRSESINLPWYTYHSVDVLLFMAAAALLLLSLLLFTLKFLFTRICRRKVKRE
ncbi:UDP-glucuronosyltransferase 2C1-like [Synchiropus splendidus]|uniref:UDP-glucuronosyltransferase 2C1-like n=1 Tax=Synchiropus splendidus TaxID=270530 RepID=UPI00237E5714|nr:UDP-glucuronosyltransferase 2C1-like [Synchiropus splendidus]